MLELHYPMIQFLIIAIISRARVSQQGTKRSPLWLFNHHMSYKRDKKARP